MRIPRNNGRPPARADGADGAALTGHRGFRYLLAAHAASQLGTQVSIVVLPLVAVLTLRASAFEVGALVATETLGYLLIGLPAGVWIDRLRKRPIMVTADLVRGVLLLAIPVSAAAGTLAIWQLYLVAGTAGLATVMFGVSYQSSLPGLVGREHLVDANVRMESVRISATLIGPGIAGWLVQLITAPYAILVDAFSYFVSAILLFRGRTVESPPAVTRKMRLVHEIREGFSYVIRHPILRLLAACSILSNFFAAMFEAAQVPFLVRDLHLQAYQIGLIGSAGAVGGAVGVLTARRFVHRFGAQTSAWASASFSWPFTLLLPLARPGLAALIFPLGWIIVSAGIVIYNISQVSLRQTITPEGLLGRMNATIRFLGFGSAPLGALIGGFIGQTAGVRAALWTAAIGIVSCLVPLLLLRRVRVSATTEPSPQPA